ncbi:hypothetical protein M378DRAFT_904791 [Amanita muscaria Koide BX008]|uniref:Uncharacterized protein n=1 Tax=Amanita muscaria (strain Koide BX008) TaxID=946122 RepID=A0A0C2WH84_AMAMK|nr:hypothetical protein M378DRAFT_904791 [Amanita muscaria Koide BX008]
MQRRDEPLLTLPTRYHLVRHNRWGTTSIIGGFSWSVNTRNIVSTHASRFISPIVSSCETFYMPSSGYVSKFKRERSTICIRQVRSSTTSPTHPIFKDCLIVYYII